jgi:hypothetical protein
LRPHRQSAQMLRLGSFGLQGQAGHSVGIPRLIHVTAPAIRKERNVLILDT